ncbi:MAG TPA: metallophosphoesterase [Noviherbaspirillum sp.]|nr:metallophosphoesterase [Noviherbaspirillum sp.]
MKIQVASDLHLEFLAARFAGYRVVEPTDADVLVLAGDIHRHTHAIDVFRDWPVPVVYVHGNHELYDAHAFGIMDQLRQRAEKTNVHYLEKGEVLLHGVRFLGCCLWTDYRLFHGKKAAAMREAERCLNDHRLITTRGGALFTAIDAERVHLESRQWLEHKLAEPFAGRTVVVTHHAPHPLSIHPRYAGDLLNAAFVSDLTPLVEQADLWIHGHVHDSFDYRIGKTRIVANPRGYARNRHVAASPADLDWENPCFAPRLVVDLT